MSGTTRAIDALVAADELQKRLKGRLVQFTDLVLARKLKEEMEMLDRLTLDSVSTNCDSDIPVPDSENQETKKPELESGNGKLEFQNHESGNVNCRCVIPETENTNQDSGNPKTQNGIPETRNVKTEFRNPETQNGYIGTTNTEIHIDEPENG